MSQTINCSFARAAVRKCFQKHRKNKKLPAGALQAAVDDYNEHFNSCPSFQLDYESASKAFPSIDKIFLRKWNPPTARIKYLELLSNFHQFSNKSTLRNCRACQKHHLAQAFPSFKGRTKKKVQGANGNHRVIAVTNPNTMSPKLFAKQTLADMNEVCDENYGQSFTEILQKNTIVSPPEKTATYRKATNEKEITQNCQR